MAALFFAMSTTSWDAPTTITADFASPGLPVLHRASGVLHTAFSVCATCPWRANDSLLEPLHLTSYRGREAIDGHERLAALGITNLQVVLSDFYGYACNSSSPTCDGKILPSGLAPPSICCQWPGVDGNWSRFDEVIEAMSAMLQKAEKSAPHLPPFMIDIWNEPDQWGTFWHHGGEKVFFELWERAVKRLRTLNPRAKIIGPSFGRTYNCDTPLGPCGPKGPNGTWDGDGCYAAPPLDLPDKLCGANPLKGTTYARLLQFAEAHNVLPDVLSWHEWSPLLSYLPSRVREVVDYLKAHPAAAEVVHSISINEAIDSWDYLKPGAQVAAYAAVEEANEIAAASGVLPGGVSLIKTNLGWGTVDGDLIDPSHAKKWRLPDGTARGTYFAHRAYGQLAGAYVRVQTSGRGVAGLATWDDKQGVARVLAGAYVDASRPPPQSAPADVVVRLTHLPPSLAGAVHVTLTHILDTEAPDADCEGTAAECFPSPKRVASLAHVSPTGELELRLPPPPNETAGYCSDKLAREIVTACSDAWLVEVESAELPAVDEPSLASRLQGVPPLAKPHYSWPLTGYTLRVDDANLREYARVSGSLPISLNEGSVGSPGTSRAQVAVAVEICAAIGASLTINYSPWYTHFTGDDPTVRGAAEAAELGAYRAKLAEIATLLAGPTQPAVSVGAIVLDSEKFAFNASSSAAYLAALSRKNDLIYNLSHEAFPKARILQYGRGGAARWPYGIDKATAVADPWVTTNYYTRGDRGDVYSTALYTVPEIGYTRETFNRTVGHAVRDGVRSVTPFVALGAGERRSAALHGGVRLSAWDYDLVYSWMLGAEINDPFYARFPGAYAAWDYAHSVVLWPSVFDARFGPANWKHFVAYARGAAGLDLDSE